MSVKSLNECLFTDRLTAALSADTSDLRIPRQVANAAYSWTMPTKVGAPVLLAWSADLAEQLGLSSASIHESVFTELMAGNRVAAHARPYAARYGGHQFGHWAGQLGDGRAIVLGELRDIHGQYQTLQLKGAGLTPYSRTADGRAVLRSSIREFLCSEAMHHLGVPTTRALSLVGSGEAVMRDMFYDGRAAPEPGAIVCRVAPNFIRFGNFQMHAAAGEHEVLDKLCRYTIETAFPEFLPYDNEAILKMFAEVVRRTATLIAHWMRVGFVHGVMNTDNMSILGLTIDYGPYGWLDNFDANWTPNTTDRAERRYRFGRQADIALWNLLQLANALYQQVDDAPEFERILSGFPGLFQDAHRQMTGNKLGIIETSDADDDWFGEMNALLQDSQTDMTLYYRMLTDWAAAREGVPEDSLTALEKICYLALSEPIKARWSRFFSDYMARQQGQSKVRHETALARMQETNPIYVLRNYLAQQAIEAATEGDLQMLHDLHQVLQSPYQQQDKGRAFVDMRPDWALQKAGCSQLSCSS